MNSIPAEQITEEASGVSAVRSHQSFDSNVYTICHHSGRYLTRQETNPGLPSFLREQHEFPAFQQLDRYFAHAAHARQHQHFIWSEASIKGVATLLSGTILLFATATYLLPLETQIANPLEFSVFYTGMTLGIAIGTALILGGIRFFVQREELYHRNATGKPPTTPDFPLSCNYDLKAIESLNVHLGNVPTSPQVHAQQCYLNIEINPLKVEESHHLYNTFHQLYERHGAGTHLYAGALAIEGLKGVIFKEELEHSHRLSLRFPIPTSLRKGTYTLRDGPFIRHQVHYKLNEEAFSRFQDNNEQDIFPLDIYPVLSPTDSYTLQVHCCWRGDTNIPLVLEECTLDAIRVNSPELGTVVHVERGRYDDQKDRLVWRNIPFRNGKIVLKVTFDEPVLPSNAKLQGGYRCYIEGLLSKLSLAKEHIWDPRGLPLESDTPVRIAYQSRLEGNLTLDITRLVQRHEHTQGISMNVPAPLSLNSTLIQKFLQVLIDHGVTLHWIEHPAPRRNPTTTDTNTLLYWDIGGSVYRPEILDTVEVHLVASGCNGQTTVNQEGTEIDLRVRCLYDPRDPEATRHADTLFEQLKQGIQDVLDSQV